MCCTPAHPLLQGAGTGGEAGSACGRVIVFTNFREGVMGICEALKQHQPLITARWVAGSSCACMSGQPRCRRCRSATQAHVDLLGWLALGPWGGGLARGQKICASD